MHATQQVASPRGYAGALAVCAANLLAYFAIGVVVPVLPLYMHGVLRASDVSVGVVMASYAVTTLVGRPLGGRWGDRAGYRRPAVFGAMLIVAGTAAYSLIPSSTWLLACRLVVGFGEGLSQAACITWAVSLAPPRHRGIILSYAGVTGWAGVALGAIVGDAALERWGYVGAYVTGAVAPCIGVVILTILPSRRSDAAALVSLGRLAWTFARQGLAYALVTMGYAAVLTFGTLLLRTAGASSPSLLLRAFVGGVIAVRLIFGNLPTRLGPARAAGACAVAQAVGTAIVAATPGNAISVAVAGAVAGLGFGLSFPSIALDALGQVPPSDRGGALGVVSAFFDVGLAAAGPVLGWIAERAGYPAAFLVAAACAGAAAPLVLRARRPSSVLVTEQGRGAGSQSPAP